MRATSLVGFYGVPNCGFWDGFEDRVSEVGGAFWASVLSRVARMIACQIVHSAVHVAGAIGVQSVVR